MKYFFSKDGDYIGGFDEGSLSSVPKDSIEVSEPPGHGFDKLIDGVVVPYAASVDVLEIVAATFNSLAPEKQAEVLQKAKELLGIE